MSNEQRVQNGAWHIARVQEHVKLQLRVSPLCRLPWSSEPGGSVPFFTFLTILGLLVPWHCFDLHLSPSAHWKLRASRAGWRVLLSLFTFGAERTRQTAGSLSTLAGPNASPCFPLSVCLSFCLLLSLRLPPWIGMVFLGHKSWPARRV